MSNVSRVGIIANPASGKDIRRLVAHGSTFDNNEKTNIVRRVLLGLDALGVDEVHYLPESYSIVPRAADTLALKLKVIELPMVTFNMASDSREAAQRLAEMAVGCIVTLGGDGTNRVVAKGCGDVPLVAISTGTNNVFPMMVEGTLAGLAAGLVATGAVPRERVIRRAPRLDVWLDGEWRDLALIDVVTSHQTWVGARALWDPAQLAEVVLSRVTATEIGMAGLGGFLFPEATGQPSGVHIVIGAGGQCILAPLAPGLLRAIPIAAAHLIAPHDRITLHSAPCTVALDGEREFAVLRADQHLEVSYNPAGPYVVDINAALQAGATNRVFQQG